MWPKEKEKKKKLMKYTRLIAKIYSSRSPIYKLYADMISAQAKIDINARNAIKTRIIVVERARKSNGELEGGRRGWSAVKAHPSLSMGYIAAYIHTCACVTYIRKLIGVCGIADNGWRRMPFVLSIFYFATIVPTIPTCLACLLFYRDRELARNCI